MTGEIMEITDFVSDDDFVDIDFTDESSYEVWAVGYNGDESNAEMFINKFDDPDDAVEFADNITISDIINIDADRFMSTDTNDEISRISVEIETITLTDDSSVDIMTVYKRDLWVDGEYGGNYLVSEEEIIVNLAEDDFEVLNDGSLKIRIDRLEGYSEKDKVQIRFINEIESSPITYEIIDKVGDYFICNFIY